MDTAKATSQAEQNLQSQDSTKVERVELEGLPCDTSIRTTSIHNGLMTVEQFAPFLQATLRVAVDYPEEIGATEIRIHQESTTPFCLAEHLARELGLEIVYSPGRRLAFVRGPGPEEEALVPRSVASIRRAAEAAREADAPSIKDVDPETLCYLRSRLGLSVEGEEDCADSKPMYRIYGKNGGKIYRSPHRPMEAFGHVWYRPEGESWARLPYDEMQRARSHSQWQLLKWIRRLNTHPLQDKEFPPEVFQLAGIEPVPRKKEALVMVWAPWCLPCRESLATLAAWSPAEESPCRLRIYSICVASDEAECEAVFPKPTSPKRWTRAYLDASDEPQLFSKLGNEQYPQEFLVGQDGLVRFSEIFGGVAAMLAEDACPGATRN